MKMPTPATSLVWIPVLAALVACSSGSSSPNDEVDDTTVEDTDDSGPDDAADDPMDGDGADDAISDPGADPEDDATDAADVVEDPSSDPIEDPSSDPTEDPTSDPVEEADDASADADPDAGDTAEDVADPPPCDPACGSGQVCVSGTCTASPSGIPDLDAVLLSDPTAFNNELLIYQLPDMSWAPSRIYRWDDFVTAVYAMHLQGVGDFRLWFGDEGDDLERRAQIGLVNLAAFLAQSMKETIRYDACDENNWDNSNGYQISNACGQLGQDYASYDCDMACPRDPTMRMTANTHAQWYGAPGPFFCAPDQDLIDAGLSSDGSTGYWDYTSDCFPYPATEPGFTPLDADAWERPDCEVYAGQRAGRYVWDGSGGSVEGCCWWGRGVIQTTGRCNFGVLNHYLGDTHLDTATYPRPAEILFPDIDFCSDPQVICSSTAHPELKWIAGLFYWMSSVETYDVDGWNYREELAAFVDGGLMGTDFIDAVSGIVNRGCHNPPCATGAVDGVQDRRDNFDTVLRTMGLR